MIGSPPCAGRHNVGGDDSLRQHGGGGWRGGEVPGSGFADLLRRECLIDGGHAAVQVGRVAEEQVERGVPRGVCEGLLLDGEAAENRGAHAVEGFVRDALVRDLGNFAQEFLACELRLLGRGGEIEGEEAGVITEELRGADLIGESEFLADAGKQRTSHVGCVFLDHGERVAVRTADSGAMKTNGKHGLFFRQADVGFSSAEDAGWNRSWFA